MVNQKFVDNVMREMQRRMQAQLVGAPVVYPGGVQMDHGKSLAHGIAANLIPFFPSKYEATEFLYGWLPLGRPAVSQLFFQIPALNVKGHYVPSVGQFATIVPGSVPETIVAPKVGFKPMFMPLSAVMKSGADVKLAAKTQGQWPPMVAALNAEKKARKAAWPKKTDANVSTFYVRVKKDSMFGLTQLAPYRGLTIITAQRVPMPSVLDDRAYFDYGGICAAFESIAAAVAKHSTPGAGVGTQITLPANRAMMELVLRQAEAAAHTG